MVDSAEGDLDFVELGLRANYSFGKNLRLNGQLFSFELGDYGNYKFDVNYLFVDWKPSDIFGIRVGRVKTPFGVYTDIQDIDLVRPQILLPMGFYDPRLRDLAGYVNGSSLYGTVPIDGLGIFEYDVYWGMLNLKQDGGIAGEVSSILSRSFLNPVLDTIDSNSRYGIQIWWSPPLDGLRIGLGTRYIPDIEMSGTAVFPNLDIPQIQGDVPLIFSSTLDFNTTMVSIEQEVGAWHFVSEYYYFAQKGIFSTHAPSIPESATATNITQVGWYGSISRMIGERIEAAFTYTEFYADKDDRQGLNFPIDHAAYNKDKQISLVYKLTENLSLKGEVHFMNGTYRLFNQNQQNPTLDEEDWMLWSLKSTFSF